MKKNFPALVLAMAGLAGCAAPAHEPANLDPHKAELRRYVDSGQYQRDIVAVAKRAQAWLEERTARRATGERLTMIFDLDETLLSNWPFMRDEDLGGSDAAWDKWLGAGKAPVIEPVRDVYRMARRLGVEVVCITTRHEHLRVATEENLRTIDCADYAALRMEPEGATESAAVFKAAQRRRLIAEGRVIIANIGDQESDLAGGFAERTFKLPDPFYFTP